MHTAGWHRDLDWQHSNSSKIYSTWQAKYSYTFNRNMIYLLLGSSWETGSCMHSVRVVCDGEGRRRDTAADCRTHTRESTTDLPGWGSKGPLALAGLVWRAANPPGRRATGRSLAHRATGAKREGSRVASKHERRSEGSAGRLRCLKRAVLECGVPLMCTPPSASVTEAVKPPSAQEAAAAKPPRAAAV